LNVVFAFANRLPRERCGDGAAGQSPPLRGRCPAGQRGVERGSHLRHFWLSLFFTVRFLGVFAATFAGSALLGPACTAYLGSPAL